jgi:hypothetical protein
MSAEVLGGWHPEQEDAPGGGSAAADAVVIPSKSSKTLTRLAALGTLSRSAGEGLQGARLKAPLPHRGRGGTKPGRAWWVRATVSHPLQILVLQRQ